ncbi:D-glucuronyl C5-epimerase family protein [Salinibacterium sp. NK8237]|uniref:D-glucuronyl C5-epimerase family protein n=1 Tax=Salinibacterium sp. NK8237 TaxID=2792038 RepID=UPI0018CED48F|nr:D-glucuronyl C5-epimerase family protein [Salinibacterium sp. NK8237]MBH0128941.1 hypothetical protein [Salinibacterium sp. NK8237]
MIRRRATRALLGISLALVLSVVAGCSPPSTPAVPSIPAPPTVDEWSWTTTGFSLSTDADAPYSDRAPADVHGRDLDDTGLAIYYERNSADVRADHPVVYAQYGISALMEYESSGDPLWLDRAARQAEQLVAMRMERGEGWWYPYSFDWTYEDRTLTAPWWSGMAQGQALSLFTRLAQTTGEEQWATAADHTWASFQQEPSATEPWSTFIDDDHLWFEEYAGDQHPLMVLNGQIFAIFGLYDYWNFTQDQEVARYIDGGATTVLNIMQQIRKPGEISYYCVQDDFCARERWQDKKYHVIHSWQLNTLARLTGDAAFGEWADQLEADWKPSE